MENMLGGILSDLAGGLAGGIGMAACTEIGGSRGQFQPAHGSAPDIMGQDSANPLAEILSEALMLDYLGEKSGDTRFNNAAQLIENVVEAGFAANAIRPREFGGDMGARAVAAEVLARIPVSGRQHIASIRGAIADDLAIPVEARDTLAGKNVCTSGGDASVASALAPVSRPSGGSRVARCATWRDPPVTHPLRWR